MLPYHVAIIMDGNGRWAEKRMLPRTSGYRVGAERIKSIVKISIKNDIKILSLFAFSTENWQRPKNEVNYLMGHILTKALKKDIGEMHKLKVNLRIIGDRTRLNKKLQKAIYEAEQLTADNNGLKLIIALSYSGKWDIVQAFHTIYDLINIKKLKINEITEKEICKVMSLNDLPDPDLLIRTSGEKRISNFMLWQLAYTELYFTDVLWPDFREHDFEIALNDYAGRKRRFGRI